MSQPSSPWDRLYADIKIQIPGVTDAVMAQVVFSLFKDFCDKTNIWTEDVPIPVQPNVTSYSFTVANKGTPNRLLLLYDPAVQGPDKRWVSTNVQMMTPGVIEIGYSPSTATTWHAVVAKTPKEPTNAENYPDIGVDFVWVLDKYREALTFGILARLQMMPGKPYSNMQQARYNNQYYISERGKARTDAIKANVFGGQRWVYPQSFATVRRGGWT
jgi:hypothetical protein